MKKYLSLLILPIIFVSLTSKVNAFTFKTGDTVNFPKTETIDDNLFVSGQKIKIESNIKGDLFCAGQEVDIQANVDGDVICVAQNLNINGKVSGSIRSIAQSLKINGQVAKNITVAGQTIDNKSQVTGEAMMAAQSLNIEGSTKKSLLAAGNNINLLGTVGKDANLYAEKLNISKDSHIGGALTYESKNLATIENEKVIVGKITHNLPKETDPKNFKKIETKKNEFGNKTWFAKELASLFFHLIIALIILAIWKKPIFKMADNMLNNFGKSLLFGFLILIATPLVIVTLLITIIGIPISIMLGMIFAISLFLSRIFVALVVGRYLVNSYLATYKDSILPIALIGVFVSFLVFAIPVAGCMLSVVAVAWGLGGVYFLIKPAK
jgi:cytoskeletal protein CcmA (bactofilin family)